MTTPTEQRPKLPARDAAIVVVRRLVRAGHVAYFAGGCVRDRLMGDEPKDYDIATDARPDDVKAAFPHARSVGEAFGVMLVRSGGHTIEVATFRTDGTYSDSRRPDEVEFTDAENDARRRDFTINGLFEDPLRDEVIDFVGGRADLDARIVRAIGDPVARLNEDRLRMLRAIRFAARLRFTIEPATAETIREGAGLLDGVSRERIGQEVRWMLTDVNRAVAAWEMQYLGLDLTVLRAPSSLVAPRRLGRLPDDAVYPTALAAWMLDRCSDPVAAPGTVPDPDAWADALMLSGAEQRALAETIAIHRRLYMEWPSLGVAAQKRLAAASCFDEALLLVRAENAQHFVDVCRRVSELARTGIAPPPLIDGEDLIAAGLTPGPSFREVLDGVYDAQLEGRLETREAALELARAIHEAAVGGSEPPRRGPESE